MNTRSLLWMSIAAWSAAACAPDPFPIAVTIDHEGPSNPTVAVAPDGTTYAAWVSTRRDTSDVYLARVSTDGITTSPIRVNDVRGDAGPHEQAPAQVAVGTDGIVHVVWQTTTPIPGRRFPASDLRYARSDDGGRTFGPATTVNGDADGPPSSHTFHDVVAGDDGLVIISWLDGRVGDSLRAAEPKLAEDHIPGSDIRVAVSRNGGLSFPVRTVVDTGVCPCCRTVLVLGARGEIHVGWRKVFDGNIRDVVVATSRDGGSTFDQPRRVHADDWVYAGCPHAGPDLAIDHAGRLHATWYTGAPDRAGLYHAVSADGGRTFGSATPLAGEQPPSQAKIAVDAMGVVWLAWERRDAEGDRVISGRMDPEGWSSSSFPLGGGRSPALSASGGHRAVAWLGDGGAVRMRLGHEERRAGEPGVGDPY